MSEELKEVHKKIGQLDDKFDGLNTQQALISQSVGQISKALDKLVDIRAETLVIMQQCEANTSEHTEVFERLRSLEIAQAACKKNHENFDKDIERIEKDIETEVKKIKVERIKPLESNQTKGAWLVISFVIIAVLAMLVR